MRNNIKFNSNKVDDLIDKVLQNKENKLSILPKEDRALLYAMFWCGNEKSNKEHYTVDSLISIAKDFYNFL